MRDPWSPPRQSARKEAELVKWAGAPTRRQMHQVGRGTPRRGLCEVVTGCSAACRPVRPRCSPISLAFSRHEHIGRSFRWSCQPQNSTSRNMRDTETLTWGLLKVTTGRVCVSLARCAAASLGAAPIPPSPLKYRLSINFFFFYLRVFIKVLIRSNLNKRSKKH